MRATGTLWILALLMLALLMLVGCSAMSGASADPAFTPEGECARNGGIWHAVPKICEYNFSALPRDISSVAVLGSAASFD